MESKFYAVRNDGADSWQICTRVGSPCMARGTLAQALATAERIGATRANGLSWPIPVWHAIDDDTPAAWDGELTRAGEWTARQ